MGAGPFSMRRMSSLTFAREPQRQRPFVSLAKAPNRAQVQGHKSPHPILALQRSLGNQAVLRMRQRRLPVGSTDANEQQADRVATAVMRMPDAAGHHAANENGIPLQLASSGPSTATAAMAPASVHEVLRSPGRPLDSSVRGFMEARFKQDFGDVRVHDDARAADSAHSVSALAYTVGRDVVFGASQYAPETTAGRTLIAHELAHVLQHNPEQPVVRRAVEFGNPGTPHRDDPIPRVLASRQIDLGLTTPTVNGRQLPATDREAAARMILEAITPPQIHRAPPPAGSGSGSGGGSGSGSPAIEYQFTDFTMRVSANVNLPTAPSGGKWGSEYIDTHTFKAPAQCQQKDQVPVTMEGDPSSNALATLIQQNEQEHVDDLRDAVNAHLVPAYNWLMGLRGRGATDQQAQDNLFRQATASIGARVGNFLDAVRRAVGGRDARGGHSVCGETRVIGACDRLAIKVRRGLCSR
jgi:hypothetical protein